jgi:hypothetical protein
MAIDDNDISTEEEIKNLVQLEGSKRKELDEKKAELEKKKKEIEEFEKQQVQEIINTRKRISEKIEELEVEEKEAFEETEELRKKRESQARSLEEEIEKTDITPQEEPVMRGYGDILDELKEGKQGFYELTNYNVLNELERIAGEAENRPLSDNEKNFIDIIQYHADKLQNDNFYKNKDSANYLRRELAEIDFINKMSKKHQEEERL